MNKINITNKTQRALIFIKISFHATAFLFIAFLLCFVAGCSGKKSTASLGGALPSSGGTTISSQGLLNDVPGKKQLFSKIQKYIQP